MPASRVATCAVASAPAARSVLRSAISCSTMSDSCVVSDASLLRSSSTRLSTSLVSPPSDAIFSRSAASLAFSSARPWRLLSNASRRAISASSAAVSTAAVGAGLALPLSLQAGAQTKAAATSPQ
jgi:hypothetical protein